jgi:hypothetical protein
MRRIPDGAEWKGVHASRPIFFKYTDGTCWYHYRGEWSHYSPIEPTEYNLFGFGARKLTLEEIMEDFITNE